MTTNPLTISTGASRKDLNWKPQTLQWSELVQRLSPKQLVRTNETSAQYQAMTPAQRGLAKDIGGFVGGEVNGRRNNHNVKTRCLITLDADFADETLWPTWERQGLAGCIYSTHSHTPEKPRLRLVIPLKTPVSPPQYEPLARKVASWLNMDLFDDTTYQPARLMYWPSASKDGEYVFEVTDGPRLDPVSVLDGFTDWQDASSWPRSSRQKEAPRRTTERAPDPTLKDGWVGAFCRTYNVPEAIAMFLPEVYKTGEQRDRFTYVDGSTPDGLVIYSDYSDGDHCFSWHDTDPAKGMHNAFDLVRIHKFGRLDEGSQADMSDLPSYQAMLQLCMNDPTVFLEYQTAQFADFSKPVQASAAGGLISAEDLQLMDLPPVQWVIPGLLSHGLGLLIAPPKSYKSWLAQDLALCVSLGVPFLGFPVNQSTALYLALEDSPNRLKGRGAVLLRNLGGFAPKNLFYGTTAPTLRSGLFPFLDEFLADHPDCRLIILDTFQKVRDGAANRQEGAYATDYREAGALKTYADRHGLCILAVHHTNKREAQGDALTRISGTNGIGGAADTVWNLIRKKRTDTTATFDVTGRDVDNREFSIEFVKADMRWRMIGDAADVEAAEEARRYNDHPVVRTIRALLAERNEWQGSMTMLASEIEARCGDPFSEIAVGKAVLALEPALQKRDNIFHEKGSGRQKRTSRFYRGGL